jgi:hypothetical protein
MQIFITNSAGGGGGAEGKKQKNIYLAIFSFLLLFQAIKFLPMSWSRERDN